MTEEERYLHAFAEFCESFQKLTGSKDPFNYSRAKELHVALHIGAEWNSGTSGEDALDSNNCPVEIKTTTNKNINGTYNGLSVYDTWTDFYEYLSFKFPQNTRHIFARYEGSSLVELYELTNDAVLDILEKKIRTKYFNENGSYTQKVRKDPRIGASISMTEIKKFGEPLELHRQ